MLLLFSLGISIDAVYLGTPSCKVGFCRLAQIYQGLKEQGPLGVRWKVLLIGVEILRSGLPSCALDGCIRAGVIGCTLVSGAP